MANAHWKTLGAVVAMICLTVLDVATTMITKERNPEVTTLIVAAIAGLGGYSLREGGGVRSDLTAFQRALIVSALSACLCAVEASDGLLSHSPLETAIFVATSFMVGFLWSPFIRKLRGH
jgi:hypothetical protein